MCHDVFSTAGMCNILVNISLDVLPTIVVVCDRHHLVGMPSEVDVQSRNEERSGSRGHQIQESSSRVDSVRTKSYNDRGVRMIPRNRMHEHSFVFFIVKITGFCPAEVMHLVHKGPLTDDGAH